MSYNVVLPTMRGTRSFFACLFFLHLSPSENWDPFRELESPPPRPGRGGVGTLPKKKNLVPEIQQRPACTTAEPPTSTLGHTRTRGARILLIPPRAQHARASVGSRLSNRRPPVGALARSCTFLVASSPEREVKNIKLSLSFVDCARLLLTSLRVAFEQRCRRGRPRRGRCRRCSSSPPPLGTSPPARSSPCARRATC